MHSTLDISDDQLVDLVKERLNRKPRKRNITRQSDGLYNEYMIICNTMVSQALKLLTPLNALNITENVSLSQRLRKIAKLCDKVDSAPKMLPVITDIQTELDLLDTDCVPDSDFGGENSKETQIAVMLVRGQTLKYMRQAFTYDMFDFAATHFSDAADILDLAIAIYKKDLKKASALNNFDTNVREQIPSTAWNWMEKNL
jgi:hypothetical protein